jgi:hypothetical protein
MCGISTIAVGKMVMAVLPNSGRTKIVSHGIVEMMFTCGRVKVPYCHWNEKRNKWEKVK